LINRAVPFAFLNEEYLELVEPIPAIGLGEASVQGVAYIARYLKQADQGRGITIWTGLGNGPDWDWFRPMLAEICSSHSVFDLGSGTGRSVIRVIREVRSSARVIGHDDYRPQLRIDSPPAGAAVGLDELLKRTKLAGAALALVRASSPEFFADPWAGEYPLTDSDLRNIADRVGAIQRRLQYDRVPAVIDLRPIPPSLRIVSADTVLCTTVGRLRDYWLQWGDSTKAHGPPEELIIGTFWKLTPLKAIVCYIGDMTTVVCQRGADEEEARVHRLEASWPAKAHSDIGIVTGGDAYVAALLDGLLDASGDVSEAARRAQAALVQAVASPLGISVNPADAAAAAQILTEAGCRIIRNDRLAPLQRVLDDIRRADKNLMVVPGLVCPEGGAFAIVLSRLRIALDSWIPSKGKDLIAVFGESRSGKEHAVTKVLESLGYAYVGPVNMHQFLGETGDIILALTHTHGTSQTNPGRRPVLIIDEIQPGDSARPMLNLMAEKAYMSYARNELLTFQEYPVVLMSSIDEERLLDDLYGRLACHVIVPPLRERLEELPYLLPVVLPGALGIETTEGWNIGLSYRFLDALLSYDFLPRPGATHDPGLKQRNFRALNDLIHAAVRSAQSNSRLTEGGLTLIADDLPQTVAALAAPGTPDDSYIRYPPNYKIGTYPSL
jgi:hypothetical protein